MDEQLKLIEGIPMKKILKYTAFGFVAIVILALAFIAYFAATFNPNDHKQAIIDLVKEDNNRDLTIDGDISLSFWPKLGADLGKVSLSEYKSDKEFASITSAKVALAVLPLLKNSLVVDTIYIDGAKANIVKYKDGTTNYDDLLSTDESKSEDIQFNVQGINITNSEVSYADETQNTQYNVSNFNLTSSHIALGEPVDLDTNFTIKANQPAVDATSAIKGTFLYDPESKRFSVKGLDSSIQGALLDGTDVDIKATGDVDAQTENSAFLIDNLQLAVSGNFNGVAESINLNAPSINIEQDNVKSDKVTVKLTQKGKGNDLAVNMVLANMQGSPKAIQSTGITGDLSMTQGKRVVTGTFSSPFKGNMETLIFDIPKLVGKLDIKDPSLPNGAVKGSFNLNTHTDIKKELANSSFDIVLEDTKLKGDVAVVSFKKPNIKFNLTADKLDLNKLLGAPTASSADSGKPADMSALNALLLDGKVKINSIVYDTYNISGLNLGIKADGKKVAVSGLNVKVNDSQIKGALSISQFAKPLYNFNLDIDQVNLNDYISEAPADAKTTGDEILDLSALKALNANGSLRIGKLSYGKTKLANVRIDLKADDGVAKLAPFSASLYGGSMKGSLDVDARATPNIAFKQTMSNVSVGPLLEDTINNDMLSGSGTVEVDITTQGNTVNTFKKSLAGTSSLALANGALKGVDIAGSIREIKNKVNFAKSKEAASDSTKKTDFSELTASFIIKDGIAENNDLAMKAPILRLAKGDSKGTIDIANEKINYVAKPTIVKSLKGQGGDDLNQLSGVGIPVKIAGSFDNPKFGLDFAGVATGIAKAKLLEKVGGSKGAALQELVGGDNKLDALKGLLGKKKKEPAAAPAGAPAAEAAPTEKPESVEDKAKEKLKGLLKF